MTVIMIYYGKERLDMYPYPSSITFLYYQDLSYGKSFMEDVLGLNLVMDQGFARVYQINQTSFIGIVQIKDKMNEPGNTLVSLNSRNLKEDYKKIEGHKVLNLSKIKPIHAIGLHSFFFEDMEEHRFEIQRFDRDNDRLIFEQ